MNMENKSAIHLPYPCFREHSISSGYPVDSISMRHISLSYIFLGAYNFKASGTRFLISSEGFFILGMKCFIVTRGFLQAL
jgi:hypothetical protein